MKIRKLVSGDVAKLVLLEQEVWGGDGASEEQIVSRAEVFPDGSLVAELDSGTLIGYAVVQRVDAISTKSWAEQTDEGLLIGTHRLNGKILYGVNLSVVAQGSKYGVSGAFIEYCISTFVTTGNCNALCLGSRLPGFARWRSKTGGKIRDYLGRKNKGYFCDPELKIYQKHGFSFLWEMENYFIDPDSCDYGAMIVRR